MKKIFLLISVSALFLIGCQKSIQPLEIENATTQNPANRCGMEEAMANMSPEMKNTLMNRSEAAAQTGELLIFLDFDGAFVRRGFGSAQGGNVTSPIVSGIHTCPPPNLSAEQINTIIELVKDDFSPFNILFTTEQSVYDAYPTNNKQVCIITTAPQVVGFSNGILGVSPFAGLTNRLSNNPCFVFASLHVNNIPQIAFTISHEVGHTMGLGHQSRYTQSCNFSSEYHPGFGSGPLSFAPLMGSDFSFSRRIMNWFAQPCLVPHYNIPQNDFEFLNDQVELKEDDFPDQPGGGTMISETQITGILEQAADVDVIRINFRNPGPVTITSENIDIKATLYSPNGQLIAEYENPDDTHVTIPSANGLKYLKIEAISNVNMSSQFMTGKYRIVQ